MKKQVIRHGDVSLHQVNEKDLDLKKMKLLGRAKEGTGADYPIAFGETTGHKHVLKAGKWKLEDMFAEGEFQIWDTDAHDKSSDKEKTYVESGFIIENSPDWYERVYDVKVLGKVRYLAKEAARAAHNKLVKD